MYYQREKKYKYMMDFKIERWDNVRYFVCANENADRRRQIFAIMFSKYIIYVGMK